MTTLTAAAVSALIRRGGLRPLPSGTSRMREGVRVSNGYRTGYVSISADYDSENTASRVSGELAIFLREQGLTVDWAGGAYLTVTRP